MEFQIPDNKDTIQNITRKIGYELLAIENNGDYNIVRDLSDGYKYPRFHIYIKKDKENDRLIFNLHLDQKFASYEKSGAHSHSGEYEGKVVENEVERIKNILQVPAEGRIYKF